MLEILGHSASTNVPSNSQNFHGELKLRVSLHFLHYVALRGPGRALSLSTARSDNVSLNTSTTTEATCD